MKLNSLLAQAKTPFTISGNQSTEIAIADIAIDSRLVKKDSVFFALTGKSKNGSGFINDAISKGAVAIVTDSDFDSNLAVIIKTPQVFLLLIEFLKSFYQPLPSHIYAITGTNGKTSTAEFTRQILEFLRKKSASIGTLGINCDESIKPLLHSSSLTTPDIASLYKNLAILKQNGIDDVAIEVSSIGLEQNRIAGLDIGVGAFTNFTQDHLDYHPSMENYFECKMILFKSVLEKQGTAVLNTDITEFSEIKKICEEQKHSIIEYGFKARDLTIQKIQQIDLGQRVFFKFKQISYQFDITANGEFQVFNTLCALGNVLAKNSLSDEELRKLLTKFSMLTSASGRMQRIATLKNKAQIFIDFAHSPDALTNILHLARKIIRSAPQAGFQSKVIVLFGCGGDRDAAKRPLMGKIASELADLVIITDDNPRTEIPSSIRAEIIAGCDKTKVIEVDDRKTAISEGIKLLCDGDLLILAGKGHEKYQIIGERKFDFDEEKIALEALKNLQ